MAKQTVTLQPGESKLVSFEAVPHEARTYQVSVNGLTGSFVAVMPGPPIEGEPPLPEPGTGVPTEEEIAAVKATVRYRLDHLWFDPCADIHYTEEMNQAMTLTLQPIWDLQERYSQEMERVYNECLAEHQDELDELRERLEYLGWIRQEMAEAPGRWGSVIIASDGSVYAPYTGEYLGKVWDTMNPEARDYFLDHGGTWYAAYAVLYCPALDNEIQAVAAQQSAIGEECYQRQLPLVRARDELYYGYWYCGFPLGY